MFKDVAQGEINVAKRDGRVVAFDSGLISKAIQKAFSAEHGVDSPADLDAGLLEKIDAMALSVVELASADAAATGCVTVEHIQDSVERELMKNEFFSVARRYILYRAEHSKMRQLRAEERMESEEAFPSMMINRDGKLENLDFERLRGQVESACELSLIHI